MGLKSIEMQVALPRVQDAGKVQEQVHKQGEQFQGTLAQTQLEMEKRKRTQVQKQEELNKAKDTLHKGKEERLPRDQFEEEETLTHPYLGKRIDFNG